MIARLTLLILSFTSLLQTTTSFPTNKNASKEGKSIPTDRAILTHTPHSVPEELIPIFEDQIDDESDWYPHKLNLTERQSGTYWYEAAQHGISAFNPAPGSYKVFRNVKDYGAVGDGVADDTAAINRAITDQNRCGKGCGSSSTTPAVIYFPGGTYLVSKPLIQYYNTQFVGNPNAVPTIKAVAGFSGIAVIDSNVYIPGASGAEWYVPQSNFYRQIRNFVIDLTATGTTTPDGFAPTGIHWQVAQATSLQNIKFIMSTAPGTTQVGVFMENGSGGYLGDLTFLGGAVGMICGSQQFTSKNLVFQGCTQAIEMLWDWGWTWKSLTISQCWIGVNVTALASRTALHAQGVAAVAILDSVMTNVPIAVLTSGTTNIMLENLALHNVPIAVGHPGGPTILSGGDVLIDNWGNGNNFQFNSGTLTETVLSGPLNPSAKSNANPSLRDSSGWFAQPKPQYEAVGIGGFLNVKTLGAKGDGQSDDTSALNKALASAAGKIVYFPHGSYIVTDTIAVPPGSKIVGEAWSEIMGAGPKFSDLSNPKVMVQIGTPGQSGVIEVSDMLFTVTGATAGAVLMEWNIKQSSQGSAAMWDSHFRVGGAAGSQLQAADCPAERIDVDINCIAATMLLHLTPSSSAYLENVWVWVADHDLDIPNQAQVNVYAARCFIVESKSGPNWLWGTAAEHCALDQYRFHKTQNLFAATLQTETPYYQPSPKAPQPFIGAWSMVGDPTFSYCSPNSQTCAYAWGMEVIGSSNLMIYGAGFYSWFQFYSQICLQNELCQERIARVITSNNVFIVNLYTKGVYSMIQGGSVSDVIATANMDGFLGTIVGWTGLTVGGQADQPSNIVPLPLWIWDIPNPTVSCNIPCTILPPPTPILPIQPPVYSTTISGVPVKVTPPPIETPGLPVAPIPIVVPSGQTVTPVIAPNPMITIPPITPDPNGPDNIPGGPVPILPPPIPIPIPPAFLPWCLQFCSATDWPPILPPIVVLPGPPIPVAAPPPLAATGGEDDDPEEADEDEGSCPIWFTGSTPTGWPTPADIPPWGQSGTSIGGQCAGWSGSIQKLQQTVAISVRNGQFTVNTFDLLHLGPSNRISMDGAQIQAYASVVTSWSTVNTPGSPGASSAGSYITFNVPTNPLASEIALTGNVPANTQTINLQFIVAASTACGGLAIAPPDTPSGGGGAAGDQWGAFNTDCEIKNHIHQTYCMNIQIAPQGTVSVGTPNDQCVQSGHDTQNGVNWCVLATNGGCALVIATRDREHGFNGYVTLNKNDAFNLVGNRDNYCRGDAPPMVAAFAFYNYADAPSAFCVLAAANPEKCIF